MTDSRLSYSEKIKLMIWKNILVVWNRHFHIGITVTIPFVFGLMLIIMRVINDVTTMQVVKFKVHSDSTAWNKLFDEIESRRKYFRQMDPTFNHSVFVPQNIIAYAPEIPAPYAQQLHDEFYRKLKLASGQEIQFISLPDCDILREEVRSEHYFAGICLGNETLQNLDPENTVHSIDFKIIMPSELRLYNNYKIAENWVTHTTWYYAYTHKDIMQNRKLGKNYFREGFYHLQLLFSDFFIYNVTYSSMSLRKIPVSNVKKNEIISRKEKGLLRYPNLSYVDDSLINNYGPSMVSLLLFTFIVPSVQFIHNVVMEKDTAVRSYLKLMGITTFQQMICWLFIGFVGMLFISFVLIGIIKIDWSKDAAIMNKSRVSCLIIVFCLYSFTNASFCILISALSAKTRFCIPLFLFLWLIIYIPFLELHHNFLLNKKVRLIMYFCYNTNMAQSLMSILYLESYGNGLRWETFHNTCFGNYQLALFLNGVFFLAMGWFADNFNPGTYGTYWTFERFKFWKRWSADAKHSINDLKFMNMSIDLMRQSTLPSGGNHWRLSDHNSKTDFNYHPPTLEAVASTTVEILELTKCFGKEEPVINDLMLNVVENEILVIMGPNGCGKTVLARMIAGFMPPTSGVIYVNGIDALLKRREASEDLGLAFGTLLLLENLTVSQQLRFHSRLKALSWKRSSEEKNYFMSTLQLDDYHSMVTDELSISSKVQLAVACALTGRSTVVVLDNIDIGLDGSMHNILCDILIKEKVKRSIILTTNSTIVAETLADRIALLENGTIKNIGNLRHFKQLDGNAYYLICFKSMGMCNTLAVREFLQQFLPNINAVRDFPSYISFIIPDEDIGIITSMLDNLEQRLPDFGLQCISIRETCLKDMFFNESNIDVKTGALIQQPLLSEDKTIESNTFGTTIHILRNYKPVQGAALFFQRVLSVLRKQFIINLRTRELLVINVLLPICICCIGWISFSTYHTFNELRPRNFSITNYRRALTILSHTNKGYRSDEFVKMYLHKLVEKDHEIRDASGIPVHEFVMEYEKMEMMNYIKNVVIGVISTKGFIMMLYNPVVLHSIPTTLNMVETVLFCTRLHDRSLEMNVELDPLPYETDTCAKHANYRTYIYRIFNICIVFALNFPFTFIAAIAARDHSGTQHLIQKFYGDGGIEYWIGIIAAFSIHTCIILPPIVITVCAINPSHRDWEFVFVLSLVLFLCCWYLTLIKMLVLMLIDVEKHYVLLHTFMLISFQVLLFFFDYWDSALRKGPYFYPALSVLPILFTYMAIAYVQINREQIVLCRNVNVRQASLYINKCQGFPNCCEPKGLFESLQTIIWKLVIINILHFVLVIVVDNRNDIMSTLHVCANVQKVKERIVRWRRQRSNHVHVERTESEYSKRERELLSNLSQKDYADYAVVCKGVTKVRNKMKLIDNQYLVLRKKESLALLGPSGCGKSTLLHMITGDQPTKNGQIYCYGMNSINPRRKFRENLSYCPQKSISYELLTICQVLEIFAMQHGVHRKQMRHICESLAKLMGLYKDYHKLTKHCSDGIQRRLDMAIALMGKPKLYLFDGSALVIDQAGKQVLYSIIYELREMGLNVIITSLNVVECRLLCDRVAILLNGQFSVIDTPQEICNKFYPGYYLAIKLQKVFLKSNRTNPQQLQKIRAKALTKLLEFIDLHFENSEYKGEPCGKILFYIPLESATFGRIFDVVFSVVSKLHLDEITISKNTLYFVLEDLVYGQRNFENLVRGHSTY